MADNPNRHGLTAVSKAGGVVWKFPAPPAPKLDMTTVRYAHVKPPIPVRMFDWCAWIDGEEERTDRYGWGRTREEAIADLKWLVEEM